MTWVKPEYSRTQVKRAGEILTQSVYTDDEYNLAMDILNNWRSSHSYPINTFQPTLRNKLKKIGAKAIVAQRLKRTPSILGKLIRFPKMNLSRMQDIAGLRAVVARVPQVYALIDEFSSSSRIPHELVRIYDYIENPKESGYRSAHMIYKYRNMIRSEYNNLNVEIQVRTLLQHNWATAVETMGTFLDHALKSSEGPEEWLEFFSLTGAAFAHLEGCRAHKDYESYSKHDIYKMTSSTAEKLNVSQRLQAFSVAADAISDTGNSGYYHLVILDAEHKQVQIKSFGRRRLDEANNEYTEIEKRISSGERLQVVLVSAGPVGNLRRAYPNFFLDTKKFLSQLRRIKEISADG